MRQVYYDPFGMRMAGEQAGIRDEAFLQDQTRRARQSDYEFNVTQPLELQGLRRENDYANFYDPMRRQGAQFANNQLARDDKFGAATNDFRISSAKRNENFDVYNDGNRRRLADLGVEAQELGYEGAVGSAWEAERMRRREVAMANGDWNLVRQIDTERYPGQGSMSYTPPAANQPLNYGVNLPTAEGYAAPQSPGMPAYPPPAYNYGENIPSATDYMFPQQPQRPFYETQPMPMQAPQPQYDPFYIPRPVAELMPEQQIRYSINPYTNRPEAIYPPANSYQEQAFGAQAMEAEKLRQGAAYANAPYLHPGQPGQATQDNDATSVYD